MTETEAAVATGSRQAAAVSVSCCQLLPADCRLLWPVLLLLAAIANPVIGAPRPLDSLRLVVTVQWLSEDDAAAEAPADGPPPSAHPPSAVHVSTFGAPDSRARSTAISRARFQRPPPHSTLHG
jgi:hypothetical protein